MGRPKAGSWLARAGCLAALGLWLPAATDGFAQEAAQARAAQIGLGERGGPARETEAGSRPEGVFEWSARFGAASDYIYRGVTLSGRKPVFGAAFDASLGSLYAAATITSVQLSSNMGAEIALSGGFRPKVGPVQFDFGYSAYFYPGETGDGSGGINYWEMSGRADTRLTDNLRAAAGFAYSPNVSNSGAWSKYAAAGLALDLPAALSPPDIGISIAGALGYAWYGRQSAALGGTTIPSYVHWNAGITFSRDRFHLDLRYHDTSLSRSNCYLVTGDPHAVPGGRVDPVANPEGLMSRWCGPTVVAKLWFDLH
jgi:uncharacterized protein (TIGR02001 family)